MYEVDALDIVIELHDAPAHSAGAPEPLIVGDHHRLLLAYNIPEHELPWDGSEIVMTIPSGEDMAILRFHAHYAHLFGPPNDEAFLGHPLASRGLEPYSAFEVKHSSWIRQIERMNAVHPLHDRKQFLAGKRHFIFTFHDSMFECIAEGFEVQYLRGSRQGAMEYMAAMMP